MRKRINRGIKESSRHIRFGKRLHEELKKGFKILAGNAYVEMYEDNYENGKGDFVSHWEVNSNGIYDDVLTLLDEVANRGAVFVTKDLRNYAFDAYNSKIFTDVLTDDGGYPANKNDVEAWKNGELTLYNCRLFIPIKVISDPRDMTAEEAKQLGLEVY
jgi:hypothetical protein